MCKIILFVVRQCVAEVSYVVATNVRLIQFVALFNNGLLFVEISRRRIRAIVERLNAPDVTSAEIQEVGEDLGILLGQCLEAKIRGKRILDILNDLR